MIFDVLLLEDWSREAKYSEDRTTFLFWEHTITVTCILNADATSAARFPPLAFAVEPKRQGPVGAPGVVKNPRPAKPFDTVKRRTDLDDWFREQGLDPEEELGVKPKPRPFTPAKPIPPNRNGGTQFPLEPGAVSQVGQGLFGGGLGAAALERRRFRPDRAPVGGGGQRNKLATRFLPALNSTYPTVPATDVELRARLRRPRRQLLVWLYSGKGGAAEYMLVSPLHPDAHSDAQHGPVCTVMDCPAVHGEVSAVMRLQFTTWEAPPLEWTTVSQSGAKLKATELGDDFLRRAAKPETAEGKMFSKAASTYNAAVASGIPGISAIAKVVEGLRKAGLAQAEAVGSAIGAAAAGGGAVAADGIVAAAQAAKGNLIRKRVLATPAMLSHRWGMSFGWNPDTHLRTQTIVGEATFRADVLALRHLTADQLRGYLWHPIPEGYQRHPVGEGDVTISPDGLGVQYKVHDEQRLMNNPGGAEWGVIALKAEQNVTVDTGKSVFNPKEAPF